jgi:hypothetical protein
MGSKNGHTSLMTFEPSDPDYVNADHTPRKRKITDTERLDWLFEAGNGIYPTEGGNWYAFCGMTGVQWPDTDNPRTAIDAAIRAERKSGGSRKGS